MEVLKRQYSTFIFNAVTSSVVVPGWPVPLPLDGPAASSDASTPRLRVQRFHLPALLCMLCSVFPLYPPNDCTHSPLALTWARAAVEAVKAGFHGQV